MLVHTVVRSHTVLLCSTEYFTKGSVPNKGFDAINHEPHVHMRIGELHTSPLKPLSLLVWLSCVVRLLMGRAGATCMQLRGLTLVTKMGAFAADGLKGPRGLVCFTVETVLC